MLIGYPVWWAAGLADFMWIILAVPMAVRMVAWRVSRSRGLRAPPAFGIWLLFLVVSIAGAAVLGALAPGTTSSPVSHRAVSYLNRNATYLGITVFLLYAGNLTEEELPRRRLAWMLGLLALYTTLGGLAGMVDPHFQFSSPTRLLLPHSLRSNTYIQVVTRPGLAQLQPGLGLRPKAPFDYTNTWGESLTMTIPWLIVGWRYAGGRRSRPLVVPILLLAFAPLLYSQNRGAWLGTALALTFVVVRFVGKRPRLLIGVLCAGVVLVGALAVVTPVSSVVGGRLSKSGSLSLRSGLDTLAFRDALSSPVIGYGDTRKQVGAQRSIAVAPTAKCPLCGQQEVGSTGQLWLLLICTGLVGAIAYVGFFAAGIWHFRRDRTPYGQAGVLVLLLSLLYTISYTALSAPLGFTMLAYALLWRNELVRRRVPAERPLDAWQHRRWRRRAMALEPTALTYTGPRRQRGAHGHGVSRRRPPTVGTPISEIARGTALNLAGVAISAAATLGVTVVVTRAFSSQVAGTFFTATSLFLMVETVAGLGAFTGLVYFIARLRSTRSERRIGETLRRAILPVTVASILSAFLILALANPLARAMLAGRRLDGASASNVADSLRALAAALPFAALLDTLLGATRGYRDMRPTAALDGVARSTLQLLGALVAALLGTAALLAPLWAVAYVPVATVAWFWLRRIRRRAAPKAAAARGRAIGREPPLDPGGFWRYTLPRAVKLSGQVVIQRLDIVLVAIIRGPSDAAIYTAATRFLVVGQLGNSAISMAAQPQLSRLSGLRDRLGTRTVYQATTAWVVLLTWPLWLLAISYGPTVLSVFGHSYRTGSTVMVILGCAMLLASACGQVDVVLTSNGRSVLSLADGLIALAVNVGVDLALIPRYGITGAAIGWAAAIAAANLIPLAQVARIVRVHPFGKATLIAAVLAGVSFGLIPLLARIVFGGHSHARLAAIPLGCLVLAAGIWRWREKLQLSLVRGRRHHGDVGEVPTPQTGTRVST
jgi:O-antigen/teichoic acid export membrane protein